MLGISAQKLSPEMGGPTEISLEVSGEELTRAVRDYIGTSDAVTTQVIRIQAQDDRFLMRPVASQLFSAASDEAVHTAGVRAVRPMPVSLTMTPRLMARTVRSSLQTIFHQHAQRDLGRARRFGLSTAAVRMMMEQQHQTAQSFALVPALFNSKAEAPLVGRVNAFTRPTDFRRVGRYQSLADTQRLVQQVRFPNVSPVPAIDARLVASAVLLEEIHLRRRRRMARVAFEQLLLKMPQRKSLVQDNVPSPLSIENVALTLTQQSTVDTVRIGAVDPDVGAKILSLADYRAGGPSRPVGTNGNTSPAPTGPASGPR